MRPTPTAAARATPALSARAAVSHQLLRGQATSGLLYRGHAAFAFANGRARRSTLAGLAAISISSPVAGLRPFAFSEPASHGRSAQRARRPHLLRVPELLEHDLIQRAEAASRRFCSSLRARRPRRPTASVLTATESPARSAITGFNRVCRTKARSLRPSKARARYVRRPLLCPRELEAAHWTLAGAPEHVANQHSAGLRADARSWAIPQVGGRRRRSAVECCFQRQCLQPNGFELAISSALLLARSESRTGFVGRALLSSHRGYAARTGRAGAGVIGCLGVGQQAAQIPLRCASPLDVWLHFRRRPSPFCRSHGLRRAL